MLSIKKKLNEGSILYQENVIPAQVTTQKVKKRLSVSKNCTFKQYIPCIKWITWNKQYLKCEEAYLINDAFTKKMLRIFNAIKS